MFISEYIFVIKSFRHVGAGGEGKPPRILKFDIFPSIICTKSCFLTFEWWKCNFATFGPFCKTIFGQPLDINVGAGKFLGVRRIFARCPPNLPKKFCVTFANKFSPINDNFWCDLQKKDSCVFLQLLSTIFWSQTTLGAIFVRIFRDFDRISTNQNFGGALSPPAPRLLHHCPGKSTFGPCLEKNFSGTHVQGYMLIYRNAEGVHGQRKFRNPCTRSTS